MNEQLDIDTLTPEETWNAFTSETNLDSQEFYKAQNGIKIKFNFQTYLRSLKKERFKYDKNITTHMEQQKTHQCNYPLCENNTNTTYCEEHQIINNTTCQNG